MRTKKLLLSAAAALAALTVAMGPALADPTGTPTFRPLVGVGSDTTQGVLNGLSNVIVDGTNTKIIGSYDAVGSATITTKDPAVNAACQSITRPSGSGAGIAALIASQTAGNGCIQFARSSANDAAARPGANLTYIPFAVDAVAYAIRDDSLIPKSLTIAQLTSVYNCGNASIHPLLPQFGSGTRKFFLASLGFTDAANFTSQPGHTCIVQVDVNGNPLVENTGNLLTDPTQIAPYSTAQYLSQVNGVVQDVHGNTLLGAVNGISAAVLDNASVMSRDVFNVVPNSQIVAGTQSNTAFVGQTSQVCSNTTTIKRFGFATNPNCGATTIQTP